MLAEEEYWCRSSQSCGGKTSWLRKSISLGGKLVEKKYLVEEKQLVEEKVWIGRACISHIVSSQPLVSASWSSPRLFAAFFVSFKATKHLQSLDLEGFCSFTFSSQRFWFHTTGRTFPKLLNISPLQILFCGPFQSVLVVVCGAYENPPRRSNRPRESLTHSAGEIHGGEGAYHFLWHVWLSSSTTVMTLLSLRKSRS